MNANGIVAGHDADGGQWNLLGTCELAGTENENVELSSGILKKISADAVRSTEVPASGRTRRRAIRQRHNLPLAKDSTARTSWSSGQMNHFWT